MSFDPGEFNIPTSEWGPNVLATFPARERRQLAIGVDLASRVDYCAIAVIEGIESPEVDADGAPVWPADLHQRLLPARYEVRNLRRLPHGLGYLQIAAEVGRLVSHPGVQGAKLCIDAGGLGGVFFDILVGAGFKDPIGVTTTGSVGRETVDPNRPGCFCCGKLQLVSTLQTVLQTGRLKLPRDLPETKELLEELKAFAVTISDRGHASFAASTGHDDLISACSLALFAIYPRRMGDWTVESIDL